MKTYKMTDPRPEYAKAMAKHLVALRRKGKAAAEALAASCGDPEATHADLVKAADRVLLAAGAVRGYATLCERLSFEG